MTLAINMCFLKRFTLLMVILFIFGKYELQTWNWQSNSLYIDKITAT